MLTEVIGNQTSCLQILNLNGNAFSSVSTEKLMTKIAECGICSTLKELYLNFSINFGSDESVKKFADIIATAPVLKKCDIEFQSGRLLVVVVEYASEGIIGSIVIK